MDFFKNQVVRLQQQFGQLSSSQKMLSVSLLIIMGMTLVWWGRYAGTSEMESLLGEQEIAAEDFPRIEAALRDKGIPFTPVGARIMVPVERRFDAFSLLAAAQALPRDTSTAFIDLMGKMDSPLNSPDRSADIRKEIKQSTLAAILRRFPGVQNAMVLIDLTQKRSLDKPMGSRATVYMDMKPGAKASNKAVTAAADVVCGSVSGMELKDVKVIVNGISRLFVAEDGAGGNSSGGSRIDLIKEYEGYYRDEILQHLSYCDGVMVHVNVTPKDEAIFTETDTVDPKIISRETDNETETHTSTQNGGKSSGESGVVPNSTSNQKMSIDSPAGGEGNTTTMERTRVKTENFASRKRTTVKSRSDAVTITSASVAFPRSYFVKEYKTLKGLDKEPNEVVLADFIKSELIPLRKRVHGCLYLQNEEALVVDYYVDLQVAAIDAAAPVASTMSTLVGSHGKEIVLGVLALASLFMVSMMVRKSGPAMALSGPGSVPTMPSVGNTVDAMLAKAAGMKAIVTEDAAEVGEGGQALDGIELDDKAVRAQQVVEQVSNLVKENPEVAASMIKKWMSRS
jgi:flagellar biosynthesis/type III secretory pathway M-ring protein FliF/YscJ